MSGIAADRVLVILNPVASRLDRTAFAEALGAAFGGGDMPEVFETPADDDLPQKLRGALESAARRGAELVIAAGGDGTISLVADALLEAGLGERMSLAIVPLGTANVLAQDLEVPLDPHAALVVAAASARIRALDAIRVNDKHYLTQVGTGLDAGMIEATNQVDRQARGRWAYWFAFWAKAIGWCSVRYDLTIDGRRYHKRAWQVVVANAGTLGLRPFTWGPDIEPDDGVLDLCVFNVRSPRDWIVLVYRILTRRHRPAPSARFFAVRDRVRIATRRPRPVQGDGDLIATTPIDAVLVRGALRVVVAAPPEPAEAAEPSAPADAIKTTEPPAAVMPPPAPVAPAASSLSFLGRLGALDTALYFRVNRLSAWPPAERVAKSVARWMNSGEVWIVVAFALAIADPKRSWRDVAAFLVALWTSSMLVNFPIKEAFRRRRPFLSNAEARVLGARPADWSFPSGHSATAFAGAVLLGAWAPAAAPLFLAYAVAVGVSRVYLGVHYPGDVVIGALIGVGLAVAVRFALVFVGMPL